MVVSPVTSERPQAWQNGTNNPALNPQSFGRATAEVGGIATGMAAVGTYAKAGLLLIILLAAFGWSRVEITPRIIALDFLGIRRDPTVAGPRATGVAMAIAKQENVMPENVMQVKLGASVVCSDGQQIGTVDRLVIDPVTRRLPHLIVRQGRWLTSDRIIDRQFVDGVGVNGVVRLALPTEKINELPQFVQTNFLTPQANWDSVLYPRVGEANLAGLGVASSFTATSSVVKSSGPGGGSVSGLPGDVLGAGGYGQVNFESQSNLPSDALLIDRGTEVVDSDEKKLGTIDDFVYDKAGTITGFRVRGGFFGRHQASIPVSAVAGASLRQVRLNLPGAEVERVAPPEEAPSRLVILTFGTPSTAGSVNIQPTAVGKLPQFASDTEAAESMLEHIRSMEARGLLLLDDAVIVTVAPSGEVSLAQTRSDSGRFALRGAGAGALIGLLLGGPVGGLVAGATVGAIAGKVRDTGLDDTFIRSLSGHLRPGHSALFLLVRRADFSRILEDLRPFSAEVLHADLPPDRLQALRDALATEDLR